MNQVRRRSGRRRHPRSPQLELRPRTWGGRREGAGRPKTGRTKVAHETRPKVSRHTPVHVTLRLRADLPHLHRGRLFRLVREALRESREHASFRLCHFSWQGNHLHAICEADHARDLARGVQGLAVRLARRLNVRLGRSGTLYGERYHCRVLKTPLEVKHALAYVLLNAKKHSAASGRGLDPDWIDPYSSAAWFDGWSEPLPWREPWQRELVREPPVTVAPRSWLLSTGWREKHGPLSIADAPAGARRPGRERR